MKIITTTVMAAAATVSIIGAPIASAEDVTTTTVGSQAKLVDGNVIQGWTISDLRPSSDAIPYPVAGTLWEATATDEALQGSATPIVSNLNARARSGETYRVLFGVATPQGVNPATLAQGQKTTGKVEHPRFDAHLIPCDRCAFRRGVERSTWPRLLRVGVDQGGA